MEISADRVWERIQKTASELARRKSVPSERHAEAIVMHILREEGMELPSHDTIASLGKVLRSTGYKD
jgi:Xaa-Pro aminopeptidase